MLLRRLESSKPKHPVPGLDPGLHDSETAAAEQKRGVGSRVKPGHGDEGRLPARDSAEPSATAQAWQMTR